MNQSLKAVLQLMVVVCALGGFMAWVIPARPDATVWACRILIPAALVPLGYVLVRAARKTDLAPDLLRQQFGSYFERDGLCFATAMTVAPADRLCWFSVYYQNRYARPCTCDLIVQPGGKSFSLARHGVPTVSVGLDCPGGGVGVTRVPYPIPAAYQGKQMKYEVAARTRYPGGAGPMLRFREGLRVGSHQQAIDRAAITLGLAAVGVISIRKPASVTVNLPAGVAERVPTGTTIQTETLWTYDAPTGGFPVAPASASAASASAPKA